MTNSPPFDSFSWHVTLCIANMVFIIFFDVSQGADLRNLLLMFSQLKGHCHGNFAIFWSKPLKYLTKSLFFNKKLLTQHWEENTKVFLSEEQTIVIF